MELNKIHALQGNREVPVLFEEADGVFVNKQKKFCRKGNNSFELEIAISHEGWKETAPNRFELANKTVVCDMANGAEFNKRKEAVLSSKYNADDINIRIFNSDGGGYEGKHTAMPYSGCALTNSRKAFVDWPKGNRNIISYFWILSLRERKSPQSGLPLTVAR